MRLRLVDGLAELCCPRGMGDDKSLLLDDMVMIVVVVIVDGERLLMNWCDE